MKINLIVYKNIINIKILFFIFILFIYIRLLIYNNFYTKLNYIKNKRIGVVGLQNHNNIGNNLVKFAMFIKLKEYGFEPVIIGKTLQKDNIDFLKKYVVLKEINQTFLELNEKNYDIMMVNSDQTWNNYDKKFFLDYGFLRFAKNWTIPKFIYGASLGHDFWKYSKEFDITAKNLLKNFTGISTREKSAVNLIEKHLGIIPQFVLDPTLLISKTYYLDLIKDFKKDFNFKKKYLCVYQLDINPLIEEFITETNKKLKYTIYKVKQLKYNYVENFIFAINISEAVITDSFHGTIFSIIFNKPFISFINTFRGRGRFTSLAKTFNLKERIIYPTKANNNIINLLTKPLNINESLINSLKNESISYLKRNLGIK